MSDATTIEQFKAKSLNNTLELCYVIDNWVAGMHKKLPLAVELCDEAKNALLRTLVTMRNDIRRRRLMDLSDKPDQSYYISINHDMIAIGVETFIDPYQPNAIDDNKEYFHILGRYMFPVLSVNDWAKINGVEPNTVRQWINRERINIIKKENGIGISMMQYKPGSVKDHVPRSHRYHNVGQISDEIAAACPFLRGKEVAELHILPRDKDLFTVLAFVMQPAEDNTKKPVAQDALLNQDEVERLTKAMDSAGFNDKRERNYIAPFPDAEWTLPHRLPTLNDIAGAQESLKAYPPIGYIGKLEASDFNPVWETGAKTKDGNVVVSVKGKLIRAANPATNLLTAIFSAPDDMPIEAIKAVKNDSGWQIDNGWADDTLYINELNIKYAQHLDDAILFLKTLPYRMYNICRHQFCRVLFQLPSVDPILISTLEFAGYRHIEGTNTFYAYVLW